MFNLTDCVNSCISLHIFSLYLFLSSFLPCVSKMLLDYRALVVWLTKELEKFVKNTNS